MSNRDTSQFIGKTLAEVRTMHERVRVTRVGSVPYVVTCDHRIDRLNVRLSEEGLTFEEVTREVAGRTFTAKKVVGGYEHGIVAEAYWG